MRKLTVLLVILSMVFLGACAQKNTSDPYKRAIERSNEGFQDLDKHTK